MTIHIKMTLLALAMIPIAHSEAVIAPQSAFAQQEKVCLPNIRVLVGHSLNSATLEVKGSFIIMDPFKGELIAERLHGKHARPIESRALGLKWGEEFPGRYQIAIVPTSPESVVLLDGVAYRGSLMIYDAGGKIGVVNDLTIEDYVAAQLANQTELLSLPEEVVAAVAIAMRSQAYYQSAHPRNKLWDIDAQKVNYKGAPEMLAEGLKAADSAAKATRFMVVTQSHMGQANVDVVPLEWSMSSEPAGKLELVVSDAVVQAEAGANAAQILQKIHQGITIQRIYQKS